ncbi:MAG TPA: c-type cytochrome [Pseudolabrys sp.]|nr:c-type cytochrome [Pseudolabrys sp.]
MQARFVLMLSAAIATLAALPSATAAEGNAARGERVFRACSACHSLQPHKSMTGPSLAGIWNRKAGKSPSFSRYSAALKASGVVWNEQTLDQWIADPQRLVPGNEMTFPGVKDAQQRADLLAFLKDATQAGRAPAASAEGQMGGMMMGSGGVPNLKRLDPEDRVATISRCNDGYKVTTAGGKTRHFWERNLRLKTDSSDDGAQKNTPALVGAGMMGDRADIIFAAPEEISSSIGSGC